MSEKKATYKVGDGPTLDDLRDLPCALPFADTGYKHPTPAQVDALIKAAGWSQNDAAKIVGVNFNPTKGSTTIRKWRTASRYEESRAIPYSAWRLMLIAAGVVKEEVRPNDAP
jgi:hypothetical protein